MKLAYVYFDQPTRVPNTHDISAQAPMSRHFLAENFDIEIKDGMVIITHPSGDYLSNMVSTVRIAGSAPLKESAPVKDAAKSEAAKKAWAERKAAQT